MATDPRCEARCVHPDQVARARADLADPATYDHLGSLFSALADPNRARIVHTLLRHELCTCDLAGALDVSESVVSQHLRILRSLTLVKSRREGRVVYHRLDDDHVSALVRTALLHLGHLREADQLAVG
ncbi:MAG: ArsR/SmtB family transcription factor [Candidatus Dormibacteria bacterium]